MNEEFAGQPGQPGQPGEPGVAGGGHGGSGGAGGAGGAGARGVPGEGKVGLQGPPGEKGERGPRGEVGRPRLYGPLFGYVAASVIFIIIVYVLQFQHYNNSLENCRGVNESRIEVNHRAKALSLQRDIQIAHTKEDESHFPGLQYQNELLKLEEVDYDTISLEDCEEQFDKPWPFNLF